MVSQFRIGTPTLKWLAIWISFQMISSSGCERNWSTFVLIHNKQRNRLTQKYLNDLVYIHYNLIARLKCIQKKVELKYSDPTANDFINDEEDPMIGWIVISSKSWSLMSQDRLYDQLVS